MMPSTSVTTERLVHVKGVGKTYGKRRVLEGIDLDVHSGEIVGLIGPNGAGKSTLIRIIASMSQASDGSGSVLGRELQLTNDEVPFLGMMVERPAFIETLSGRRNLELLFGIRARVDSDGIDAVLEDVGLDPGDRRPVKAYSLGMRQRLSLAQAIGEKPSLLILDEPTNGLDPSGIIEMRTLVRRLADRAGMGILLSSHLLSEVEIICDRVVLLVDGRIQSTYSSDKLEQASLVTVEMSTAADFRVARALLEPHVAGIEGPRRLLLSAHLGVPDIARTLVAAGVSIEAIYPRRSSLEQVYLEAVSNS